MSAQSLPAGPYRPEQVSAAHLAYLSAAITRYREKAQRALRLAQVAARHGNRCLAAGLLDEARTFRALAEGLADQQSNPGELR